MKPLVSCPESARLDAATAARAALAPILLMEDASLRVWDAIRPVAAASGAGSTGTLVAVCGSGNNGGDALALLRHARFSGATKVAAILAGGRGELAALHAATLEALGVAVLDWQTDKAGCQRLLGEAALVVDGLSGTGLAGALREGTASLVAAVHDTGAPIASIDLPSGLSDAFQYGFPLVDASWTLSIEPRKACLYFPAAREACGEILPIEGIFPSDATISATAFLLEEADLRGLAPLPPDSAYKGERGRVAIFAGSPGASGAAVLASRACLASGAGLAALFASGELYPVVAPMLEAVMVKEEPAAGAFDDKAWDALLIGPGWGRHSSRLKTLEALLATGLPAVLDADAISLYRKLVDSGFSPSGPVILTPHPGEFEVLTGIGADRSLADPVAVLPAAAAALKAVIVLKSQVTWIASPGGELAVWDGRESGLGTAGSGDVLAGLAAGLLAGSVARIRSARIRSARIRSARIRESRVVPADGAPIAEKEADAFSAARAAVIAHGLAGRMARSERGWFEAGALLESAAKILGLKGS